MTQTPKPLIELDKFWAYQAVVLADKISRVTLSIAKDEAGLNLSQWRVLAAIAEKPGRMAAEVVAITPMDKTLVSRAVASLIEAELVTKTSDTQDKRRSALAITPQGHATYASIAKRLTAKLAQASDTKTPPEKFTAALKQYIQGLDTI
ncbi:MarR family winged helix-turn-helix transcriptional regulator [Litorimonas sp. RW-G-Af-16]|uniref:MarR family winged helix-turn-helix transcriptional regulator n=1 Tax=Litorimonas sp. RW-G-Af-16 TaxID=3241168 RepID=UPI00390CDA47